MFYQKGVGWVYGEDFEAEEITLDDGRKARLEWRAPNPGERFSAGWSDVWLESPGKLRKHRFRYTSEELYLLANENTVEQYTKMASKSGSTIGWVTLVLL